MGTTRHDSRSAVPEGTTCQVDQDRCWPPPRSPRRSSCPWPVTRPRHPAHRPYRVGGRHRDRRGAGPGPVQFRQLSANGRFVTFQNGSPDILAAGDPGSRNAVYLRDLRQHRTELVSVAGDGTPADTSSVAVAVSRTGRFVPFSSPADNLVPGDTNGRSDAFVRDLHIGVTSWVSLASDGGQISANSTGAMASADGRFVVFDTDADAVVPRDDNNLTDVFVRDAVAGSTERVSVG